MRTLVAVTQPRWGPVDQFRSASARSDALLRVDEEGTLRRSI